MQNKSINKFIHSIEESRESILTFFFSFCFIVLLRNFMETLYPNSEKVMTVGLFGHYFYCYLWTATSIILYLFLITKKEILKITKVIFFFFFVIWLAPVLDYLISNGSFRFTYYEPYFHKEMLKRFFLFWGDYDGKTGASPGIRIEVFIILMGSFYYLYAYQKLKILRSLIGVIGVYAIIFFMGMFPFFINSVLKFTNIEFDFYHAKIGSDFYLPMIFINCALMLFLYNKKYFLRIFKDLRFLRIGFFQLMFILGRFYPNRFDEFFRLNLNEKSVFESLILMMAIFFACLFSLITNNLADVKIDVIANPNRPTIKEKLPNSYYKNLAVFSFVFALIFSISINFKTFAFILIFIGNYFIYSLPPLRLKRVPLFSKLLISTNAMIIFILGLYTVTNRIFIPENLGIFFLIPLTFCLNFIDIKDYKGDKENGIQTLPVIFGPKKSKLLIGFFFVISYISAYFLIDIRPFDNFWTVYLLFFISLCQFYFINKKKYDERPIFGLFFLTILLFLFI